MMMQMMNMDCIEEEGMSSFNPAYDYVERLRNNDKYVDSTIVER